MTHPTAAGSSHRSTCRPALAAAEVIAVICPSSAAAAFATAPARGTSALIAR